MITDKHIHVLELKYHTINPIATKESNTCAKIKEGHN